MPLRAIESPKARGEFKRWRDGMVATPRRADYAWTTLARVLSVAKDRGLITLNPCERGGRLYSADRSEKIWTEADIARLLSVASPEMELALMLALWSGQRQGDLLVLPWSAYDGSHIRLRQSKTGAAVVVRIGAPLRELLDRTAKRSTSILTNTSGLPWTSDGFRASWRKLCVVGLRGPDEGTESEKTAVESAGLRYFNIPVTDGLSTGFRIIEFAHVVEDREKAPLLIHCGSESRLTSASKKSLSRRSTACLGAGVSLLTGRAPPRGAAANEINALICPCGG